MAVTIVMKTRGIFGKIPPFSDLLKPGFSYGTWTDGFIINPDISGDNTLLYRKDSIARGLNLGLGDRSLLTFKLALPTSDEEIKDFYEYIMFLCGKLEVVTFEKNGTSCSIADIPRLTEEDMAASRESLFQIEKNMENSDISSMYIFGVTNPLAMGRDDLKAIGGDMARFADFLDGKQRYKGRYVAPKLEVYKDAGEKKRRSFFRKDTDSADDRYRGTFEVGIGEELIFPLVPRSLNKKEARVMIWQVKVKLGPEEIRTFAFDDFIKKIDRSVPYDSEHVFINLKAEDFD